MSGHPRLCPNCRQLNGAGEATCFRCGHPLALGPWAKLRKLESPATSVLVAICFANFALMALWGREFPLGLFGPGPKRSAIVAAGGIIGMLGSTEERFRWLSAVYVHLGLLHLLMNMSALRYLGRALEATMGSWRMVTIFVMAGLGGFVLSGVYYGPNGPPTAGASGAIFGLVGAQIAEMRRARDPRLRDVLLQYLAYAVAFALLLSVNNAAHLGGFVFGYLGAEGLLRIPRRASWDKAGRWLAAVLIALSLASQVASFLSPYGGHLRQLEQNLYRSSTLGRGGSTGNTQLVRVDAANPITGQANGSRLIIDLGLAADADAERGQVLARRARPVPAHLQSVFA
jgi:membrane associated rhomboid family serine protease